MRRLPAFLAVAAFAATSAEAGAPSRALEGIWNEAAVGCGLRLSDDDLRRLPLSGGLDVYRRTSLTVRGDFYSVRTLSGTGCKSDSPYYDYRSKTQVPFYCGGELLSEGAFRQEASRAYFDGKTVVTHWASIQDLGVDHHEYGIQTKEEVLILVGEIGEHEKCPEGEDFTTYWIPPPGS